MIQRYGSSTRRILRSSSVVSVLTYVRLAWGLTDVSYEDTMGEPDRSSDRLVMLADLEIKTKNENTVVNSSSINSYSEKSFLNKCLFANVKGTFKSSYDIMYDSIGRRVSRNSLYYTSNFCVSLKSFQNKFKTKLL